MSRERSWHSPMVVLKHVWEITDWREKAGGQIICSEPFGSTSTGIYSLVYSPKNGQSVPFKLSAYTTLIHGLYVLMLRMPEPILPSERVEVIQRWSCPLIGWSYSVGTALAVNGCYGVAGLPLFSLDVVEAKLGTSSNSVVIEL